MLLPVKSHKPSNKKVMVATSGSYQVQCGNKITGVTKQQVVTYK